MHLDSNYLRTLSVQAVLIMGIILVGFIPSFCQVKAGYLDDAFYTGVGAGRDDAQIDKIVVQPDGKVLVAGILKRGVNGVGSRVNLVRLNTDGTVDLSFKDLSGTDVRNMYPQANGKIFIIGPFGTSSVGVALLNYDGTLSNSFVSPFTASSGSVTSLAVQPDGKIVVGGYFHGFGAGDSNVIRLNQNGTLDQSFIPLSTTETKFGQAVTLQPDGKILVALDGSSNTPPYFRGELLRLNTDGTVDASFYRGAGSDSQIRQIVVQTDGKILFGGSFSIFNDEPVGRLVRLNADGTKDSSFIIGTGANSAVYDLKLLPTGKILVAGSFSTFANYANRGIVRLNPGGAVDTTFSSGTSSIYSIESISIQSDGKIWIGGEMKSYGNKTFYGFTRIESDGGLDKSLPNNQGFRNVVNSNGSNAATIFSLVVQPDGKILAGGSFISYNGFVIGTNLARINSDGKLDETFSTGTGANSAVRSLVVQPDGKIIAAGDFSQYNGASVNRIVRLNPDGTVDSGFTPTRGSGVNDNIRSLVLQPDGKVIIAGDFSQYNGVNRGRVVRLNPNGSIDATFNADLGANSTIFRAVLQPDGKILVVGSFNTFNGLSRGMIARLNSDGTLDTSFDSTIGADNMITSVAVDSGGKILIGGIFTAYNGTSRYHLARLNSDGMLDESLPDTFVGLEIYDIDIQSDNKIIVSGFGPGSFSDIIRLNRDGTVDTAFPSEATFNGAVYSTIIQSDRKILIGGIFQRYDTQIYEQDYIARGSILRIYSGLENKPRFDFDGDGSDDISFYKNGGWNIHQSSGPDKFENFGSASDKLVPADYDGDGKTDIAVYRDGIWYLLRSAQGFTGIQYGTASDIPVPADFDGDGTAELVLYRPSNGTWYTNNLRTGQVAYFTFGNSSDKPVPADYDGDGKADYALFRPSTNTWYLQQSASGFSAVVFGAGADRLVPADYDGDGKTDIAVFRPSDRTWYLQKSREGFTGIPFGLGTDVPVPADYDGDGRTDLGVFRDGFWYLSYSNPGFNAYQFGAVNDSPVPAVFNY